MVLVVEAAIAGHGIAYVLRDTIKARLAAGELVDCSWNGQPRRRAKCSIILAAVASTATDGFIRLLRSYNAQAARP
jgi:DNA-binding transcriptional LysR family regulator